LYCPILAVLFWLYYTDCPDLAVMFWLSYSCCLGLVVVFWLSIPGCHSYSMNFPVGIYWKNKAAIKLKIQFRVLEMMKRDIKKKIRCRISDTGKNFYKISNIMSVRNHTSCEVRKKPVTPQKCSFLFKCFCLWIGVIFAAY
jgi:hypothetical protein